MNLPRIAVLLALLIAATTVAACSTQEAADTVFKAAATGRTWQWTASTTKSPASQSVVPDPQNYTVTFNADGTYTGTADCNQVNGTYSVSDSGITIEPGASTMAACGDTSMDAQFLAGLATAKQASFQSDTMTLTNAAGDTMTFSRG